MSEFHLPSAFLQKFTTVKDTSQTPEKILVVPDGFYDRPGCGKQGRYVLARRRAIETLGHKKWALVSAQSNLKNTFWRPDMGEFIAQNLEMQVLRLLRENRDYFSGIEACADADMILNWSPTLDTDALHTSGHPMTIYMFNMLSNHRRAVTELQMETCNCIKPIEDTLKLRTSIMKLIWYKQDDTIGMQGKHECA